MIYFPFYGLFPKVCICDRICSLVNPAIDIAIAGQCEAHIPHPLHEAEIVSAFFLLPTFIILIAEYGHRLSQILHPIQASISTDDTIGSTATNPLLNGTQAPDPAQELELFPH
jgi:hypothetical protein